MKKTLVVCALAIVSFALVGATAAAKSGTPVSLTTALAFGPDTNCDHTAASPCPASGTFAADDATTAAVLCPSGTIFETHWFTHGHAGPIQHRRLTGGQDEVARIVLLRDPGCAADAGNPHAPATLDAVHATGGERDGLERYGRQHVSLLCMRLAHV